MEGGEQESAHPLSYSLSRWKEGRGLWADAEAASGIRGGRPREGWQAPSPPDISIHEFSFHGPAGLLLG